MNYLIATLISLGLISSGAYWYTHSSLAPRDTGASTKYVDQTVSENTPGTAVGVDTDTQTADSSLSHTESQWLLHMREEEKLARDVYQTLGQEWGIPAFANIAASEQTHTDRVLALLEQYGLSDPVTNDAVGVYTDPQFTQLYTDLVAQGLQSRADALIVGATIEDLDIVDLGQAMQETNNTDIVAVYANLQKGSRNHLRSFNQLLIQETGEGYTPTYLQAAQFDQIINSPRERGPAS